jgi:hypothetical protein
VRSARLEYQILDVRCRRSSPAAPSSAPTSARAIDTANPRRVFISGQKRGVFGVVERELRRRSAIEPVIGHMKTDGHLGVCHLKGREGDAANVVLTAIGHNLRRVLAWQGFAAPGWHSPPCRPSDGLNGRLVSRGPVARPPLTAEPLLILLRRFATELAREEARMLCDELMAEIAIALIRHDLIAA